MLNTVQCTVQYTVQYTVQHTHTLMTLRTHLIQGGLAWALDWATLWDVLQCVDEERKALWRPVPAVEYGDDYFLHLVGHLELIVRELALDRVTVGGRHGWHKRGAAVHCLSEALQPVASSMQMFCVKEDTEPSLRQKLAQDHRRAVCVLVLRRHFSRLRLPVRNHHVPCPRRGQSSLQPCNRLLCTVHGEAVMYCAWTGCYVLRMGTLLCTAHGQQTGLSNAIDVQG
eukprot:366116-Chlamydomonas_euryale.AAC.2